MENDLSNYRKAYLKKELLKTEVPENPIELFQQWFYEIEASKDVDEPNAMTLSTIGRDGFPKSRVVLLKRFTWEGFVFYTNYLSEKGKAIAVHSEVCLSFFWQNSEQQIIIKGKAEKIPTNQSDGYFESRPDGSKLGAWASPQSEVVPNREALELQLKTLQERYQNQEIPRPKHWGGYLVRPVSIEFWQGRANRMHDRIRYTLQKDYSWKIDRLAP